MSQLRSATVRIGDDVVALILIVIAALSWGLMAVMSTHTGATHTMTPMWLGPFLFAWTLMMAAMMLPAVTPVVRLYQRAAAAGRVAPSGYFVAAYFAVWTLTGLPAYLLWRVLSMPLMEKEDWAMRLAGVILLLAGAYQLTPLKKACLRHCRSPMSYFVRLQRPLARPSGAFRAGLLHAVYCCGCCAALMAVLVAAAGMNLWWAAMLAAGALVERNVRWGAEFSTGLGVALAVLGVAVVLSPPLLTKLI